MNAVRIHEVGNLNVLQYESNLPIPTSLSKNEILIQNHYSGVNFIDIYQRTGLYPLSTYPQVLGREGSGIVAAVFDGCSTFAVGDRVAYFSQGSYSTHTVVSEVPSEIDSKDAAACLLQGMTAIMMASKIIHKTYNSAIVFAAAGGTGGLLLRYLKHIRIETRIGIVGSSQKEAIALENGATHVIVRKSTPKIAEAVHSVLPDGADVIFDGIGAATFKDSLESLTFGGVLLSYGNASGEVENVKLKSLIPNCVSVQRPSLPEFLKKSGKTSFSDLARKTMQLLKEKVFVAKIWKIYPLMQVKSAHSDLESGNTQGKLLLETLQE